MARGEFTLAEVARRSGASPRSIQLWANAGVLRPVPGTTHAGTGRHRRFAEAEVEIAALLVPFASLGVTIGKLGQIADAMREIGGEALIADEIVKVQRRLDAAGVSTVLQLEVVCYPEPVTADITLRGAVLECGVMSVIVDAERILTTPPYRAESA